MWADKRLCVGLALVHTSAILHLPLEFLFDAVFDIVHQAAFAMSAMFMLLATGI